MEIIASFTIRSSKLLARVDIVSTLDLRLKAFLALLIIEIWSLSLKFALEIRAIGIGLRKLYLAEIL